MRRTVCILGVGLAAALPPAPAGAQPKDKPVPELKLPALDAAEWKKQPSGLEVWDVKVGDGDPVAKSATVTIHYTGWLTTGEVFDSSVQRGKMATFPLDRLIKGWQEGIPGMKPGGVRRLKIPAALGYGDTDKAKIPAGSTLVFEIELASGPGKLPDLTAKEWKPLGDGSTGIRVWDVATGTGDEVTPGATVTIHYTGWLLDGKMFDSSKTDGGEPATFPLASLIKGWQVAVPGMKVGGTRRMELPYQYAYGERGGQGIPPKATLVFEIEVKGTKK